MLCIASHTPQCAQGKLFIAKENLRRPRSIIAKLSHAACARCDDEMRRSDVYGRPRTHIMAQRRGCPLWQWSRFRLQYKPKQMLGGLRISTPSAAAGRVWRGLQRFPDGIVQEQLASLQLDRPRLPPPQSCRKQNVCWATRWQHECASRFRRRRQWTLEGTPTALAEQSVQRLR